MIYTAILRHRSTKYLKNLFFCIYSKNTTDSYNTRGIKSNSIKKYEKNTTVAIEPPPQHGYSLFVLTTRQLEFPPRKTLIRPTTFIALFNNSSLYTIHQQKNLSTKRISFTFVSSSYCHLASTVYLVLSYGKHHTKTSTQFNPSEIPLHVHTR